MPNVQSAIILLAPHKTKLADRETYYRLIRLAFKQPRKTLLNNLRAGSVFSKNQAMDALKSVQIPPESRPQDLSIEKIKTLARLLLS
jgi:16S rRNA (adenine1518-N6/adenine1519-N6)-dimethyltransferase